MGRLVIGLLALSVVGAALVSQAQESTTHRNAFRTASWTLGHNNSTIPDGSVSGIALVDAVAYHVNVCVPAAQLLDAGTLRGWQYDYETGTWNRAAWHDQSIQGGACEAYQDKAVLMPTGRLYFTTEFVGVYDQLVDGGNPVRVADGGRITITVKALLR